MHNQVYSNDSCKVKQNLEWGGMHRCLPLLRKRRKLVFLSFMNVDPHKPLTRLLLLDIITNLERNAMHNLQD
jgi:hypothetical protein